MRKDFKLLEQLIIKYGVNGVNAAIDRLNEDDASDTLTKLAIDQKNAELNKNTKYSTEERRKQLINFFKGKNYHDYIATLNAMARDDKFRVLIDAAFGSDKDAALGTISLNESKESRYTKSLIPTQSEIDITKSLVWGLKGGEKDSNVQVALSNIDRIFGKDAVKLGKGDGMPIVTFGSYIIDGHHRWSQVYCFNPSAKMACVDFEGDLSPLEMLKAVQGCIASIRKDVPSSIVEGSNMFTVSRDKVQKFVEQNILDEVVERIKQYKSNLKDKNDVVNYITDNCMMMKSNNVPMKGSNNDAPNRGDMPQTDTVDSKQLKNKLENGVIEIPGNK